MASLNSLRCLGFPSSPNPCRTVTKSCKWNPSSFRTMAKRATMENREDPTNPRCTDFPIAGGKSGAQGGSLCGCGRRLFLGGAAGAPLLMAPPATACRPPDAPRPDPTVILNEVHPPKPQWYDELYAWAMENLMDSYKKKCLCEQAPRVNVLVYGVTECDDIFVHQQNSIFFLLEQLINDDCLREKISGYKEQLFKSVEGGNNKVLELGIGTGPNIQYYATGPDVTVYGVDPNKQMEKYAKATALKAGLPPSNFYFMQAVGEALPAEDCSMDLVVGTLVLCSVKDVHATLEEVLRVLKPGGRFIFMEHVAAPDGTPLRHLQGILNPLQKFLADGCHLNRETGKEISKAGFSDVDLHMCFVPGLAFFSPHVYGVAIK